MEGHPPHQGPLGTASEQGKEPGALASAAHLPTVALPRPPVFTAHLKQVRCGQVESVVQQTEAGAQRQNQVPIVAAEGQGLRGTIQM